MNPEKHQFERDLKLDVEARVRRGVKAVLEEVLEEEMTQHLQAGYRELTPTRRGERNGYYQRNLLTPVEWVGEEGAAYLDSLRGKYEKSLADLGALKK